MGKTSSMLKTVSAVPISTGKRTYLVEEPLARGDIANLYRCRFQESGREKQGIFKIARAAADNDLLLNEARQLTWVRAGKRGSSFHRYLPRLAESCAVKDGPGRPRQANVLEMPGGYYSLVEVREEYPEGVPPRHMAWMFNRLLEILGYIHRRGVVHGAVLPSHLLIHPRTHGLLLIDWAYAVQPAHGEFIGAICEEYEGWYPPEVLNRIPPTPATDLYLAARCMAYILLGNPRLTEVPEIPERIESFLQSCLFSTQASRPGDAWQVREEFEEVLHDLFGPRKFCPFEMPRR